MKTIEGKWVYTNNTPVASGILYLTLSKDAFISGVGQIASKVIKVTLNSLGEIPVSTNIYANDELTPLDTVYRTTVIALGGEKVWGPVDLSIIGASPINLNQLVP